MDKYESNGVFNVNTVCAGNSLKLTCFFTTYGVYAVPVDVEYVHHILTFNRLFVWIKGGGQIRIEGSEPVSFTPGNLYLIPMGQSFTCRYDGGSEFVYLHFNLSNFLGMELFDGIPPGVISLTSPELVAEIADCYYKQENRGSLVVLTSAFHIIVRMVAPFLDEKEWIMSAPTKYKSALEYAFKNCRASLSVKELADYAGVSRSSLSRWLQHNAGITLKGYLEKMLLQKAMRLLGGTGMSVKEVALELGFDDHLYFFRLFKRLTGHTPMNYRRSIVAGVNGEA